MECEFKQLCNLLYKKDLNCDRCDLLHNLYNDNVNNFLLSFVSKKISTIDYKDDLIPIKCPRSLNIERKINLIKPCNIYDCSYYSKKVSYSCLMIHKDIFFKNHDSVPQKLLEVCLGVDKFKFNRFIDISIYISRMYVLLLKYMIDFKKSDIRLQFNIENFNDWVEKVNTVNICPICSAAILKFRCNCNDNKKLRKKRIKFKEAWVSTLTNLEGKYNINSTLKEVCKKYNIKNTKFIRSLISDIKIGNTSIKEVPFGYLFYSYKSMFKDSEGKLIEGLGLNDKQYNKVKEIFI